MTSVGYGQRFPVTMVGKGVAMASALFGAFYMAMPLTIIGSTFYRIYVTQEDRRRKQMLKKRLKTAALKIAMSKSELISRQQASAASTATSGLEHLYKTLNMLPEHHATAKKFCDVKFEDLMELAESSQKFATYSELHMRVLHIISLYIHTEDDSEIARQHIAIAKSLSDAKGHDAVLTRFRQMSLHLRGEWDDAEIATGRVSGS